MDGGVMGTNVLVLPFCMIFPVQLQAATGLVSGKVIMRMLSCEQYLLLVGRNFKWAGPIMNCMNTIYRQLLLSTFRRVHLHSNPNICIYVMYVTTVNILLIYQCTMTYDESKTNKFYSSEHRIKDAQHTLITTSESTELLSFADK